MAPRGEITLIITFGPASTPVFHSAVAKPFVREWRTLLGTPGAEFSEVYDTHLLGGARRGKWSRPDATAIEVVLRPYLASPQISLSTYEIKRATPTTEWMTGALEAASHHRWAQRASLVIERSREESPKTGIGEELTAVVRRFGLGLYRLARIPKGHGFQTKVDEVVEPVFREPEPEYMSRQLALIFDQAGRKDDRGRFLKAIGRGD